VRASRILPVKSKVVAYAGEATTGATEVAIDCAHSEGGTGASKPSLEGRGSHRLPLHL
jgi:hypothetical protein